MGEDAHEFAKIYIHHALVAANYDQILIIIGYTCLAPVGGARERHQLGAERIDEHELGTHSLHVNTDCAGLYIMGCREACCQTS